MPLKLIIRFNNSLGKRVSMYTVISLISLFVSCYVLIRILKSIGAAESFLMFFLLFAGHVVIIGFGLSSINRLGNIRAWAIMSFACMAVTLTIGVSNTSFRRRIFRKPYFSDPFFLRWYEQLSFFERSIITSLFITTVSVGFLNLMVVLFVAPHNSDSLAYHLPRVAYYIQHNNLNYFDANYWTQVIHPKNSSLLLIYTYLVSGRNENLFRLVQFISYWIAIVSVYKIARKLRLRKTQGMFAALVFALLIECLMEAVTPQNDMIMTAYTGIALYFLLAFRDSHRQAFLLLAAMGIGLAVGTKASYFLVLPELLIVAGYGFLWGANIPVKQKIRNGTAFLIAVVIAVCVFALPSGYADNYRRFNHPIGPERVRTGHSFEGKSLQYILLHGTKNMLRYGFGFLSIDGAPKTDLMIKIQETLRFLPRIFVTKCGIDLESPEASRASFKFHRSPMSHEDGSSWGIFGFSLIWIAVLLSLMKKQESPYIRLLAITSVLFVVSQSYSSLYDPWRGRFFMMGAIFATPIVGIWLETKNVFIRGYIAIVVLAGCFTATSAVLFRDNLVRFGSSLPSVFMFDRMQQLTRGRERFYEPLKKFDNMVPEDAIVAVYLSGGVAEYALFGKGLTRTLIPIGSRNGNVPIPVKAEYILYRKGYPLADIRDVYLGENWYLRKR